MQLPEVAVTVMTTLVAWAEGLFALLPNLVVAALVVFTGTLVGKLMQRGVHATVHRLAPESEQVGDLLAGLVRLAVIALALFIALGILRLDKTVTSLLAGVGVLGIGLGFALQDLTANLVAGVLMSIRRYPFVNGDLVETAGAIGVVEKLELRSTSLRRDTGELVIVPNKDIFQTPLVNLSESGQLRVDVQVGVSYREDLTRVRALALDVAERLEARVAGRDVDVFFVGFGESSIDLVVRVWIPFRRERDRARARSELIVALKRAFDEANIKIPFPIRTLEFGDVGGDRLRDELVAARDHSASTSARA